MLVKCPQAVGRALVVKVEALRLCGSAALFCSYGVSLQCPRSCLWLAHHRKGGKAEQRFSACHQCKSHGCPLWFPFQILSGVRALAREQKQGTQTRQKLKLEHILDDNYGNKQDSTVNTNIWALINILSRQNGHSSFKKVIFRKTFARRFAESFCHPIFRKNILYLSRNFRPPNRGAFLSQSFAKRKVTFTNPVRESFADHFWSTSMVILY